MIVQTYLGITINPGVIVKSLTLKCLPVLVLTLLVSLVGVSTAEASFLAYICNDAACSGGGDVIVTDNAAGDSNFAVGAISLSGVVVNGVSVLLHGAVTKPILGSSALPSMDLTYQLSGPGVIWLYASDTDFTGHTALSANFNDTIGGSATGQVYGGNSNLNLDLSTPLFSPALNGSGAFSVGGTTPLVGNPVNPYSLTLAVAIDNRVGGGFTSGDISFTPAAAVPEPDSLTMLGLGLLGVASAARRRYLFGRIRPRVSKTSQEQ